MTYLTTEDVIYLHSRLIAESGGLAGIKNPGSIESSVAQPTMTFDGVELYPTLAEKAAALSFSLNKNHCFEDGNKRIAHLAMESFLVLNGYEITAGVDEQERIFLDVAAGVMNRESFCRWVETHITKLPEVS